MYAIIETGGKQYKVREGDTLFVEMLPKESVKQLRLIMYWQLAKKGSLNSAHQP